MPTLTGEVRRVTYENEETGFRVVKVAVGAGRVVPLVGVFQAVGPGSHVRATGQYVSDDKHGQQFRADSVAVVAPETLEGIERFLGSGVIQGLGPGFAKRIVAQFGVKTLEVLDNTPERLSEVPGLGQQRQQRITEAWSQQRRLSNIRLLLQSHGASLALANRIVQKYDDRAAQIVERHPYRLALEVRGIGFKTADRIATSLGFQGDHPERVQAGVLHQLGEISEQGHVCVERPELVRQSADLLQVEPVHVDVAIDALWAQERIVIEESQVFLRRLFEAEAGIVEHLRRLLSGVPQPLSGWQAAVERFERDAGYPLSEEQRGCVQQAAFSKVQVITGGPGVGKTTLVRAVLHVFQAAGLKVALAAPTGRAAKRLSLSTGKPALTLHRLLEYDPRLSTFSRDEGNPVEADALVVDEASMVDVQLAHSVFRALPDGGRVVIVGDVDQLPSVGPGAVLADILESGSVPTARLTRVFRQQEASSIVRAAHSILRGEEPVSDGTEGPAEFFWIERKDPEQAAELVRQLVVERIGKRFGFDPLNDIQVLTPMHRGATGTEALNRSLQAALNPSGVGVEQAGERLCVGDKVMQVRNDYEKETFNGDVGRVTSYDPDGPRLRVDFDGRDVLYVGRELESLCLAYATTVHKSQGSEYPAVVFNLLSQHFPMLSRNLVYTAVTRAKQLCVLVADRRALRRALSEDRRERRSTGLAARLRSTLSGVTQPSQG